MNAGSNQKVQRSSSWLLPVVLLGAVALLILLLADFGSGPQELSRPSGPDQDSAEATPSDLESSTTIEGLDQVGNDRTDTTKNPAKLDSGWYWSVSHGAGPSSLWISSPQSERRIGQTVDQEGNGIQLNDVAISPSGDLFAISRSSLYQLDPADQIGDTVPMQKVGPLVGADAANGLTFLDDGRLIAAGRSGLSEVDPETGIATSLMSFHTGYESSGDLIAGPDKTLLVTLTNQSTSDSLAQITLENGDFQILLDNLPLATYGLTSTPDKLYGLHLAGANESQCRAGGVLIEIDLVSQTTSTIRCLDFSPGGSAHSGWQQ